MNDKTKIIVQLAMTEYMILMGGALLLFLASQIWPDSLPAIGLYGGLTLVLLCVGNFLHLMKLHALVPTKRDAWLAPRDD